MIEVIKIFNKRYEKWISADNLLMQGIIETIENYLSGNNIDITENNYSFLLSFAYLYKLTNLRMLCDDWKKNNIGKIHSGIPNCIIRKYGICSKYIIIFRKTK